MLLENHKGKSLGSRAMQGVLTLNTERKTTVNRNKSKFLFCENSCTEKKLATEWEKILANYSPTND